MKIFSAFIVLIAALTQAAGAQTAPAAPAAPAPQVALSGWKVECDSQGTALNCRVTNRATEGGTGFVIAALGIAMASDTKKPILTLQLPLGLAVTDPVTLSEESISQPYSLVTCDRAGCFARAPISDALLDKMRDGKQGLRVAYNVVGPTLLKQTVTLTLPLDGFAAALNKIK
jgi:invasion protein IalB